MTTIAFHRPARLHPLSPPAEAITLPVPPTQPENPGKLAGLLQAAAPLVMSLGSTAFILGSGIGRGWLVYALPAIMVAGVVLSMVVRWAQGRAGRRKRRLRAERYLRFLEEREVLLRERSRLQRSTEDRIHPGIEELARIASRREHLWERRLQDPDFLDVRLGRGALPMASPAVMEARPDPLAEYEPELVDAAGALVARYGSLPDGPITTDLGRVGSLAVVGDRRRARALVRALLLHLSVLCSPDDLRLAISFPTESRAEWEWAKWLPHSRDPDPRTGGDEGAPICMLADSAAALAAVLSRTVRPRVEQLAGSRTPGPKASTLDITELGRLLLVIDSPGSGAEVMRLQGLREVLPQAAAVGVSVIHLVDNRLDEPGHVDARVEIDAAGEVHFSEAGPGGRRLPGIAADAADPGTAEGIARTLAGLRLEERHSGKGELAANVRLIDLLHLPSAAAVDPHVTWRPRSRHEVMRVPLGMGADGEPLLLDLKEASEGGMGPHGLVIGATGSGKSELLRTLVTGLAVTHAPHLLNFVFVDFKGGAAFAELAALPHVAGMITNLQGDLCRVDRMYSALLGEQRRRQRMLRDAGNLDGIKEYQARSRGSHDLEPMPYLLIVVDEFGELLAARPDFLDLFIAIGRVGRSLGMHLLLATQRLEEGRIKGLDGHLRYRICLRTFSPQESQAVLGAPDAYTLPSYPGAGYFKVDTSIYRRFKTALVSAAVDEAGARAPRLRPVTVFRGLAEAASGLVETDDRSAASAAPRLATEMEIAVDQLNRRERRPAGRVHQVWLPPLEPNIPLDAVLNMAGVVGDRSEPLGAMKVPLGVVDLPLRQEQQPFVVDFSTTAGHLAVVGAPQTGKSTFLRTLITSFALTHSPEAVQFYCVDLGGGTLHRLEQLPHVGAVAGKTEGDRLRRLVRQMSAIVEEREILFRRHGIDSMASFRRLRRSGDVGPGAMGDAFLVIDNWAQFRQEFEEADTEMTQLCTAGLAYGVHVVLTAGRWADIRSSLRDTIGGRLEFRLNDPMDSEMPRGASRTLPQGISGRGLTLDGLHFQAALPRIDSLAGSAGLQEAVDNIVGRLSLRWAQSRPAPAVRMLPLMVPVADLPEPGGHGAPGVPLGVEEFRLEPVSLDLLGAESHGLILGDGECGKTTLIRGWMHQLRRRHTPEELRFVVVDYRRTLLDSASSAHIADYAASPALARETIERLRETLIARIPAAEVSRRQLISRNWWSGPEYVVFVDDYDLVAGPAGNPIQPLVELLAQARDIGLHLVLARRTGGVARSAFEAVYQRVKELGSPGFIMSGDPQEGPILGSQRAQNLPPGRGFLVRRGRRTTLVQTLNVGPEEP